jgi:hypothetical protein
MFRHLEGAETDEQTFNFACPALKNRAWADLNYKRIRARRISRRFRRSTRATSCLRYEATQAPTIWRSAGALCTLTPLPPRLPMSSLCKLADSAGGLASSATLRALRSSTHADGSSFGIPRYDKSAHSGRGDRADADTWPQARIANAVLSRCTANGCRSPTAATDCCNHRQAT